MIRDVLFALYLLSSLAAHSAQAQELSLLAGGLKQHHTDEHTYAWSLDYQRQLGDRAALGFTYLNEGHPDNHHRDGIGAQIWARSGTPGPGFSLAAGVGPYYYFDTTSRNTADHRNDHGWGTLASLSATWHMQQRWFLQLRANRVFAHSGINTSSALLGVGYRLDDTPEPDMQRARPSSKPATSHELTLSSGTTIVNSFKSERAAAASVEYRRGLGHHLDWTVAWLKEGNAGLLHRRGVATQLWLMHSLAHDRLALGFGAGPYLAVNREQDKNSAEDGRKRLAGLLSLTARYRVTPDFMVRFSWSRVITDYHRDSDVLLIGVGYTF